MGNWDQPKPISDVMAIFPYDTDSEMIPPMKDIPKDYPNKKRWLQFQRDWFFLGKLPNLETKPGVDTENACRHLHFVQSSFSIKHEHKEVAVAWLASLWFESIDDAEGQESA